jgi:hypothetical protein
VRADRPAAGRLAADRHASGVAAEGGDVLLDPAQRRLVVHQPVVAGRALSCGQLRVPQEAEGAEAVVHRHPGDPGQGDDLGHVGLVGAAVQQAAAVDEHVGRQAVLGRAPGGSLHVDEQAVLGLWG